MNLIFWEHAERVDFDKLDKGIKANKTKASKQKAKYQQVKKINNGKKKS